MKLPAASAMAPPAPVRTRRRSHAATERETRAQPSLLLFTLRVFSRIARSAMGHGRTLSCPADQQNICRPGGIILMPRNRGPTTSGAISHCNSVPCGTSRHSHTPPESKRRRASSGSILALSARSMRVCSSSCQAPQTMSLLVWCWKGVSNPPREVTRGRKPKFMVRRYTPIEGSTKEACVRGEGIEWRQM
eukprot:3940498-Rhodomonas_salina.1